ncbi:MAG TPA: hypothetical protein GXZ74_05155 [Tissierellia bacterium]|nr:hypothetical protein [Tissierellia bacterium]
MEKVAIYHTNQEMNPIQRAVNDLLGTNLHCTSVMDLVLNPTKYTSDTDELKKIKQLKQLLYAIDEEIATNGEE